MSKGPMANGELPEGWERAPLGDRRIASIIMGQSPSSASYNTQGVGLPFFQGKADFGMKHPTPTKWCSAPSKLAEAGDVLISVRAPVGDVNIATGQCCIGRGIGAVRHGLDTDGKFLFYALMREKERLAGLGTGAIFGSINKNVLYEFELDIPSLPEQETIAGVLSMLQGAVEAQDKIIATLKELKAATLAKLFREGLRGEPLKETEIGEIPESWEVVTLGQIASIERGKFSHRPRNDPRFYGGIIPFVQTGDVAKSGGRIRTYSQTLNEKGLSVSRIFPSGTILLTIAANIADTGILEFDSAFPDSLVGIMPEEGVSPVFLEAFLQTQKAEMDRLAPKGTQKNITLQFLRPWLVPIPPADEQEAIAKSLRTVDDAIEANNRKRVILSGTFGSMLHLLMTGELRLPNVQSQEWKGQ